MLKRIYAFIISILVLFIFLQPVYSESAIKDYRKICEYSEGTIKVISFSSKWNTQEKLKLIYDELLNNYHGEEIKLLSEIYLYPDEDSRNLGEYNFSWKSDKYGLISMEPGRFINMFDCDKLDSVDKISRTLSHEYGHHFTYYYAIQKENSLLSDSDTIYAKLRGLQDNPKLNNGEHKWDLAEIAAEDYVQLFGTSTYKNSIEVCDITSAENRIDQMDKIYDTLPYNFYPQENTAIQLALNNPAVRQYWLDAKNDTELKLNSLPSPSYLFLESTNKIDSSNYKMDKDEVYGYKFRWTPGKNDEEKKIEYSLVAYPDKFNGFGIPIKTLYTGNDLSGIIGYFKAENGEAIYYDGVIQNSKDFFYLIVYSKDEDGNIVGSNILKVDTGNFSQPKTNSIVASRYDDVQVVYDGKDIRFDDAKPVVINGRTMVPLRKIFETMGAQVSWEDSTKIITATKDKTVIVMQVGNTSAMIAGYETKLDTPPQLVNGRTYVPLRFIGQGFGNKVEWDGLDKTVLIK